VGWGKFLFLGGLGNRLDLDSAETEVRALKGRLALRARQIADQDELVRQLKDDTAELKLYLAAIVRLLISKRLITQEEFARFVEAVDASDGARDGKFGGPIAGEG
jgi:hypothetical protein